MKTDPFDLSGKVALVTGSSSGFGLAFATALAERGASVAGLARRSQAETKKAVEAAGGHFFEIKADLAVPASADEAVARTVEAFGRLDILVNNAGKITRSPAEQTTDEDWAEVIDLDLSVLFRLSRAAAKVFLSQSAEGHRGKIINIASVLSFQGGILVPAYAAAKHGVLGLTRALANEWAAKGINVNAIAPGYFETEMTKALREDPVRSASILGRIPAGRFGKAEDLKGALVFLASSASDYMHGEAITVDGGWLSR
ncbi:2-dehydro-3-deoxy-D-gluconate 5-dehydrogenase KduD [Treponema sp.]